MAVETGYEKYSPFRYVSWASIFAGAFVSLVILTGLTLLGYAVGAIDPPSSAAPLGSYSTGVGIWYIVSSILAFFGGGWVTGRLCGPEKNPAIHSVVMWGLATIFSLALIINPVSMLFTGVNGVVGRGLLLLSGDLVEPVRTTILNIVASASIAAFIGWVLNVAASVAGSQAGATIWAKLRPEEMVKKEEEIKREIPRAA